MTVIDWTDQDGDVGVLYTENDLKRLAKDNDCQLLDTTVAAVEIRPDGDPRQAKIVFVSVQDGLHVGRELRNVSKS